MALEAFLEQKRNPALFAALTHTYAEDLPEEERQQLTAFQGLPRKGMDPW